MLRARVQAIMLLAKLDPSQSRIVDVSSSQEASSSGNGTSSSISLVVKEGVQVGARS